MKIIKYIPNNTPGSKVKAFFDISVDVIVDGTDSTIPTISAATVDTLITFHDVAADSVTFGSGHRIGAHVRFISNGTKWIAINMGNHTMTIAT